MTLFLWNQAFMLVQTYLEVEALIVNGQASDSAVSDAMDHFLK